MKFLYPLILLLCIAVFSAGCSNTGNGPASSVVTPTVTAIPTTLHTPVTIVTTIRTTTPTPVPTTPEKIFPRPSTGLLIAPPVYGISQGELTVDNIQGGVDAVAVLTPQGSTIPSQAAYIRDGDTFTMQSIRDGGFNLYFIHGMNWDPDAKIFTQNPRRSRFTETLDFVTTNTQYTTFRVTLYGVAGGNARTQSVSEQNFPQL